MNHDDNAGGAEEKKKKWSHALLLLDKREYDVCRAPTRGDGWEFFFLYSNDEFLKK